MKKERCNQFPLEKITIVAMSVIIAYQLMVPPIIGVADNGDFARVLPWFGLQPLEKEYKDRYFNYINRNFTIGQERQKLYISSELLFVKLSLWLNKVVSKDGLFDLRLLGFTHSVVFLYGIWLILVSIRKMSVPLRLRAAIGGLIIFFFCDAGYIAYFNSFYGEPAILVSLFCLVGSVMGLVSRDRPSWPGLLGFFAFSTLFVSSKTQYNLLGFILTIFGIRLSLLWENRWWKRATILLSLLLSLSTLGFYLSDPKHLRQETIYASLFYGILKHSPNPQADLSALGLKKEFVSLAGTHPYSRPDIPIGQPDFQKEFFDKVGYREIVMFYVTHPGRLIRMLQVGAEYAFTLQPVYLGNFEKISGYPAGARSHAFAVWSQFKGKFFPRSLPFLLFYFCLNAAAAITIRLGSNRKAIRLWADFCIVLLLLFFAQIFIAVIGAGEADLSKHLFLFYLLFDLFVINILAILFGIGQALSGNRNMGTESMK